MQELKEKFIQLSESLLSCGVESQEIDFWKNIFDSLTLEEQKVLINNLKNELKELINTGEA